MAPAFKRHSLTKAKQKALENQVFGPRRPGALLHDVAAVLDAVGSDGLVVTVKRGSLPIGVLRVLNQKLALPNDLGLAQPRQRSFASLDGLLLILKSAGLLNDHHESDTRRLIVAETVVKRFQRLNPTEQYFVLLESWLFYGDPRLIGVSATTSDAPFDFWNTLARKIPNRGLVPADDTDVAKMLDKPPYLAYLTLLNLFGLIKVKAGAAVPGKGWQIAQIKRTGFGEALRMLLSKGLTQHQATPVLATDSGYRPANLTRLLKLFFQERRNRMTIKT